MCPGVAGLALLPQRTGASGALAASGARTQLQLNIVKAHALAGALGNGPVVHPVADTHNYGNSRWVDACIINANSSYLQNL
jgi:hypothetical protein